MSYHVQKNRAYPRYLSNRKVSLVDSVRGLRLAGVMKNLSLGGAYVEASELGADFFPGDSIQLFLDAPASGKNPFLDCKVIWKKEIDDARMSYGLSFLDLDLAFELFFQDL